MGYQQQIEALAERAGMLNAADLVMELEALARDIRHDGPHCDVDGCHEPAEYEGWYKVKDPAGYSTGLMRKARVCEGHRGKLINS